MTVPNEAHQVMPGRNSRAFSIMNDDLLLDFFVRSKNAGCNSFVIDICMSYWRYCNNNNLELNFFEVSPTIKEMLHNAQLGSQKFSFLEELNNKIIGPANVSIFFKELIVWYAYNLCTKNLPILFSTSDLAKSIGITSKDLHYLSKDFPTNYSSYKIFKRDKKNYRNIDAPIPKLKSVQRWIYDNILSKFEINSFATAYAKGCSIKNNARFHTNSKVVINLDIKSFFPSISFSRVLGLYISFGYVYPIALTLTKLSCHNGVLPQGAPTSPAIANLICRGLDKRLSKLATSFNYQYSRYADDMTFSGNEMPDNLIREVEKILIDEGFNLNKSKNKIFRQNQSQRVTGLIVNTKVNIPKIYYRRIRAIIHNLKTGKQSSDFLAYSKEVLFGHAYYIYSVNKSHGMKLLNELNEIDWQNNQINNN